MIVRIGRGHIRPGTWDEYERVYRRLLVEGEKPPGLQTRLLVRDQEDEHGGYTIAIWDDEASLAEWLESSAFAGIQDEMRPFFVGDYQVHTCDVRVHEQLAGG